MVNIDDDLDYGFWPTDVASYESKYCPYCDFGGDDPDDCICDERCGAVGCQGILSIENNKESAPK